MKKVTNKIFCSFLLFFTILILTGSYNLQAQQKFNHSKYDINIETKANKKFSSVWLNSAIEKLEKEEYYITYSEKVNTYQSPNRKNNLRFTYYKNGFNVEPRITKTPKFNPSEKRIIKEKDNRFIDDWNIKFKLENFGRSENELNEEFSGNKLMVNKNRASIEDEKLKITYKNNKKGMRQNFIVKENPAGKGFLNINLNIETNLNLRVGADVLSFTDDNSSEKMKYSKLKIWDSDGKELRGWFELINEKENGKLVSILVNDENARYPVTIDPLSTTEDWFEEINEAGARFGASVATAGDINGDGYSDVIIGAYLSDGGETSNSGEAFVYYGSETGLPNSYDWKGDEIGHYDTHYGYSVGTAGDVNGDGFSDVFVGERNDGAYNNGAVYIYYGSSTGLPGSYDWFKEGVPNQDHFGTSASSAGDINGDGYSDVIIGSPGASEGAFHTGKAEVFYGSSSGLSTSAGWTRDGSRGDGYFGWSVSTAGDVNGDGFSDIIIGERAPDFLNNKKGRAYLFLGSSGGLSQTADWMYEANSNSTELGFSVSTAGDVNGDGYSDVIVGERYYTNNESNEGRVYLFYGNSSSSGLSNTPDWTKESDQADAEFGYSVGPAGDVNGDGYSDLIIGSMFYEHGETEEGRAYVFYGSSGGVSSTAEWTAESNQQYARFGISVFTAGDVNNDGFSDILVGSAHYDNGETDEGAAFLYYGGPNSLNDSPDFTASSNDSYGASVSTAGDVNGDGYADVIVGYTQYGNGETEEGRALVYLGGSSGPSGTADWTIESNNANAHLGNSVSTAGDVNGDGYSDVIVGAEDFSNGETEEGKVFVYYGSSTGLSGTADWTYEADQDGAHLGSSVATAGDVNGDGFSDIIVGAKDYSNGESNEGRVFVFYGSSSGPSQTPDETFESDQSDADFGSSVSTAGDVNGDGFADILIGAPTYQDGQFEEGRAYVYHGSSSGLSSSFDWGFEGNDTYDQFGFSVSTAGDVNGDGFSDVIVGAPFFESGTGDDGKIFLFNGSSTGLNSSSADWTYTGNNGGRFGNSVSTAGDINSDGYSDIITADRNEGPQGGANGEIYLYLGSSTGLPDSVDWTYLALTDYDNLGYSSSSAGDVNGDGFSDVIFGAPAWAAFTGKAQVFFGNATTGLNANIQQYEPASSDIIGSGGLTGSAGEVKLSMFAKNPFGRTDGKLKYQIAENGIDWDNGSVIEGTQSSFTDLGTSLTGVTLEENISGISTGKAYNWRVRIEYDPINSPYKKYSPWVSFNSYKPDPQGGFKAQNNPLPVELSSFTAMVDGKKVQLNWWTSTEVDNYGFSIERMNGKNKEEDGKWNEIGFVKGAGNSNSRKDYSFVDKTTETGKYKYRLKQIDTDGSYTYSDTVEVNVGIPDKFSLSQNYPNPFNPATKIEYTLPVKSDVEISIYNVLGERIKMYSFNSKEAGNYTLTFEASGISSGVYVYQIKATSVETEEKFVESKKMIYMR